VGHLWLDATNVTDDKEQAMHANDSYTNRAATATLEAARTEQDFGGWLAGILARIAAELGSTEALTAGRPGSWEADLVQRLVKGTVGYDDELLKDYHHASPS
jgi:hypothetical protein